MFVTNWIAELANISTEEAETLRTKIERNGLTPPYGWLSATDGEVRQAIKLSKYAG